MEEKEMNPCPFCGGETVIDRLPWHDPASGATGKIVLEWRFQWRCVNCSATSMIVDSEQGARHIGNRRAPQGWQQMTPDTKFEDGERIVAVVNGWAKKLLAFSKSSGFEDERGFPVFTSSISDFVRLPK